MRQLCLQNNSPCPKEGQSYPPQVSKTTHLNCLKTLWVLSLLELVAKRFRAAQGWSLNVSLIPELRSVELLKLPDARKQVLDVKFVPERSYFFDAGGGHFQFDVSRIATVQPSVASR